MKFEVSERIVTRAQKHDILNVMDEQFRKVARTVKRVGDILTVKSIEPTFGSANRKDTTTVDLRNVEDGFLCVADVNYRPSGFFWMLFIFLLFSTIGWVIPLIFYFYQKKTVKEAVQNIFSRIRNEFQETCPASASKATALDQLEKLAALKEKGFITDAEYIAKKKVLLDL